MPAEHISTRLGTSPRIVKLVGSAGRTVGLINAHTSSKRRMELDKAFQKGEVEVIVASPATAAVGFNWGHVNRVVFASMDYQDSSFMQGYRRAIRGKRATPLLIYVLEYRDSIDQRIFLIVDQKAMDAQKVDGTREVFNLSRKMVV